MTVSARMVATAQKYADQQLQVDREQRDADPADMTPTGAAVSVIVLTVSRVGQVLLLRRVLRNMGVPVRRRHVAALLMLSTGAVKTPTLARVLRTTAVHLRDQQAKAAVRPRRAQTAEADAREDSDAVGLFQQVPTPWTTGSPTVTSGRIVKHAADPLAKGRRPRPSADSSGT